VFAWRKVEEAITTNLQEFNMNDEPTATPAGANDIEQEATIPFRGFLEAVHPSVVKKVAGLWQVRDRPSGRYSAILTPPLRLFCPSCEGERTFRSDGDYPALTLTTAHAILMSYLCSDCRKARKQFFLWVVPSKDTGRGRVYKYGEKPPFGVPVPNKLLRLFDTDGKTFLKGRQCENQGLGIGAFAYYRRMVENHKNDIFDEIIKVCETLRASPKLIEELGHAKNEVSFTKAVAVIKTALPDGLLIDGHNPLIALHRSLSTGLHNDSDGECLEAANAVRIVLTDLVEKMSSLRQDKADLSKAVQLLLSKKGGA
jgi:hypothetical protein